MLWGVFHFSDFLSRKLNKKYRILLYIILISLEKRFQLGQENNGSEQENENKSSQLDFGKWE